MLFRSLFQLKPSFGVSNWSVQY